MVLVEQFDNKLREMELDHDLLLQQLTRDWENKILRTGLYPSLLARFLKTAAPCDCTLVFFESLRSDLGSCAHSPVSTPPCGLQAQALHHSCRSDPWPRIKGVLPAFVTPTPCSLVSLSQRALLERRNPKLSTVRGQPW